MTAKEQAIAKRILNRLHELDGGQEHGMTIHGEIGGMAACTVADFDAALAELDRAKFVIGIRTKFKGVLWTISDAGEAARLQM